ncbi:MAG: hypothetical protein QOD72_2427 [Acidimicrobiaceae bacterium]|nr:hypothetical protein [Acidimicrobiaceae bacterium]
MTSFRISYEGPRSFAVRAATLLAEADGIELTSSEPPAHLDDDSVRLALTVHATAPAIADALSAIAAHLPRHATMRIDDSV